jgi:hypothetical protein
VTKFIGKFRKNQDYNEDYDYAKNFLHSKRRRGEHGEIKKLKNHEYEDTYKYEMDDEISPSKKD